MFNISAKKRKKNEKQKLTYRYIRKLRCCEAFLLWQPSACEHVCVHLGVCPHWEQQLERVVRECANQASQEPHHNTCNVFSQCTCISFYSRELLHNFNRMAYWLWCTFLQKLYSLEQDICKVPLSLDLLLMADHVFLCLPTLPLWQQYICFHGL